MKYSDATKRCLEIIFDRKVVMGYSDAPHVIDYEKHMYDKNVLLRIMSDLLSLDLRSDHRYDSTNPIHLDVSALLRLLLEYEEIPINYYGMISLPSSPYFRKESSPFVFALNYGFDDVSKAIMDRKDFDPNLKSDKNPVRSESPFTVLNGYYNSTSLKNGVYSKFLSFKNLKVKPMVIEYFAGSVLGHRNEEDLQNMISTIDLLSVMANNKKLPLLNDTRQNLVEGREAIKNIASEYIKKM